MDLTDVLPNVDVSIHAPVGGATDYILGGVNGGVVSIHAPVGGATLLQNQRPLLQRVSIHAPVGGATFAVNIQPAYFGGFNSRARRGRD